MGLFADIKAMKEVTKIKNGEKGNLSISQITGLITNMMDARNNLDPETFKKVYKLFNDLRKCNTKMRMEKNEYIEMCTELIEKFDAIAPYIKYSGGNEIEMSLLMKKIKREQENNEIIFTKEDYNYTKYLLESAKGLINEETATSFVKILHINADFGKKKCLLNFEKLATDIMSKDKIMGYPGICFLSGVLNGNGIVTEDEMDDINDRYEKEMKNAIEEQEIQKILELTGLTREQYEAQKKAFE